MIEIIDTDGNKMIAIVVANVKYMNDNYIIYCVDRGDGDANIFVSKLMITSDGYIFNNDFSNGEKEILESLVNRIVNKDDIASDGFVISNDISLSDINYFNVDKCYVATVDKKIIKDIMVFYKLVNKKTLERPIVEVVDDKRVFNEGFAGNIFLIILGLIVIIVSLIVVVGVFR